jgi:hypothetical protein
MIRVGAKVSTLMNMNHQVFPINSNCVHDVLVDDLDQFLDRLLRQTLGDNQRSVDHSAREVEIEPPYRFPRFHDGVALGCGCARLALKVEVGQLISFWGGWSVEGL